MTGVKNGRLFTVVCYVYCEPRHQAWDSRSTQVQAPHRPIARQQFFFRRNLILFAFNCFK